MYAISITSANVTIRIPMMTRVSRAVAIRLTVSQNGVFSTRISRSAFASGALFPDLDEVLGMMYIDDLQIYDLRFIDE